MNKNRLVFLSGLLGIAAPASAATLVSLATFGGGDGWRAPNEILTGDAASTSTGANYNYLGTGSLERGMAYNPVTGNLVLVSRSTAGNGIRILNGTTGADQGALNQGTGIITGGTFAINQVGVGGDGVIYVANLTANVSTSAFKIYSWANESATATTSTFGGSLITAYGGTPRMGDSLDVTGSGSGTRIAAGASGVIGYSVFSSSSITNVTAFTPAGPLAGDMRLGITFAGSVTDVWGKQTGANAAAAPLRETSYSPTGSATGSAILTSGGEMAMDYITIGASPYLATLDANSSVVRIYDATTPTAPALLTSFTTTTGLGAANANGNGAGSIKWGQVSGDTATIYAMSSNQGIQAMLFTVPEPSALLLGGLGTAMLMRRRRQ